MSDPLQAFPPDTVAPFVSSAATGNAVLAAARDWRALRRGNEGSPGAARPQVQPALTVWVRNDTGGSLPAFSVLALGEPVASPADEPYVARDRPVFPGTAPAGATDVFAVTTEPAKVGGLVRATVTGATPAYLSVSDEAHACAAPAAATTSTLASAANGPARVAWKESGTGAKWAIVLIGQAADCGSGAAVPFLAQLTELHSQNRWNFRPARRVTSPAEGGHEPFGDEVTGGLAYGVAFPPLSPYARYSAVNNVEAGQVVLMWESAAGDGTYEFLPQQYAGNGSDGLISVGKQIIPGYKVMPNLFISNGFGSGPGGNIIHFTWGDDPETDPNWALIRTTSPVSENPYPTGLELLATNFNLPEGWRVEPTVDKTFAFGVDGDRGVYVQTPNLIGVGPAPKGFSHDPASAASGVGLISELCPYGIPLPTMLYGWGGTSGPWFQEAGPNTIYAKHGSNSTCFYRDALNVEHDLLGPPDEIDGGGP
ncbi:Uncharacterized protein OS=Isosphaera pallida (strain ATCC 43644 / DSM 9630 / IS1B) GN=Isop_2423 PE=4 SV=1 [Gemmataceae bacterium]|nr:Uncharacterized protein OS=Isosphaera pallida (strain ATCC 43644 / DSM 9630 / IS1B) GN=Isop_2423 PE=4 SV=1 [Gemmataceae bacterium]VTU00993.1 Uncharacterized protein OS=Isosphaera pallida (strain ATCC 43644 / DSM 9630 / IS1B) GN=Isop_2423 PE=4 SV=1 [Gemmataceae bacterium]